MKTITLRTLVREPLKVKRMTRAGGAVRVTDRGMPLWIIQAAETEADKQQKRLEMEKEFEEVRRGPQFKIPLSKIVLDSRR